MRPTSSKRGLEDTIKQEQATNPHDFETPVESNTVTRGVDFNGGIDDSYEEEYENEYDDTIKEEPINKETGKLKYYK